MNKINTSSKFIIYIAILIFSCQNSFAQKTYTITELYKMCLDFKNYSARDIESRLIQDDYYATADELYSDTNLFEDRLGNAISTFNLDLKNNVFIIVYRITKPNKERLDSINNELKNYFYSYSYTESGGSKKTLYTSDGKCVFDTSYDKNKLEYFISLRYNLDGNSTVVSRKIELNKIEINSFVTRTNIFLKKGEKIKLKASGNIGLGTWAGYGDSNGIDGFEQYNKIQGFRHGALIATIGNQNAVAVGNEITISAIQNGELFLYVNDSDPSNNSGSFVVEYSIIK